MFGLNPNIILHAIPTKREVRTYDKELDEIESPSKNTPLPDGDSI